MHVGIIGHATWFPEGRLTAADLAAATGIPEAVIALKFGVKGKPVAGPPRWMSHTTSGTSAITAQPMASPFNDMPGPLEPVTATRPAHPAPIAMQAEAISSSHCTNVPPYLGSSRRSISMTSDQGVIG